MNEAVYRSLRGFFVPEDCLASIAVARPLVEHENSGKVADIEHFLEQFTRPKPGAPVKIKPPEATVDPNVRFALSEMERILGTKVRIVESGKSKGKIEIEYYSAEDLSRIYELIIYSPI